MRYSTRTLLIGVLVIAVLITGVRWIQLRSRWLGVRDELRNWARSVDRTDGEIEQYTRANLHLNQETELTSHTFSVLTGEPVKVNHADGTTGWTTMPGLPEDPSRFFVVPPGVWVDDIDRVMVVWDHYYDAGFSDSNSTTQNN